jgi:hypothetical protein
MMRRVLCKNNGIVIVALNDVNRFVLDAALDSPAGVTIVGSNGIFTSPEREHDWGKEDVQSAPRCRQGRRTTPGRASSGTATPHTGTMRRGLDVTRSRPERRSRCKRCAHFSGAAVGDRWGARMWNWRVVTAN